jgi:hypothetical protein
MTTQYVYLIQEREFIKTGENIYKPGKTKQENNKRLVKYPKNSRLLLQINCPDCDKLEREILKTFKMKYNHRKDIGSEYFEGDGEDMIQTIYYLRNNVKDIINQEKIEKDKMKKDEEQFLKKKENDRTKQEEEKELLKETIRQKKEDELQKKEDEFCEFILDHFDVNKDMKWWVSSDEIMYVFEKNEFGDISSKKISIELKALGLFPHKKKGSRGWYGIKKKLMEEEP